MSTPIPIDAVILDSNTTLYDPFITSGATVGMLITMHFVNRHTADVTIDVFLDKATDIYICDDKVIPAKGNVDWTGIIPINDGATLLKAIASVTSVVHVSGCVMENA